MYVWTVQRVGVVHVLSKLFSTGKCRGSHTPPSCLVRGTLQARPLGDIANSPGSFSHPLGQVLPPTGTCAPGAGPGYSGLWRRLGNPQTEAEDPLSNFSSTLSGTYFVPFTGLGWDRKTTCRSSRLQGTPGRRGRKTVSSLRRS